MGDLSTIVIAVVFIVGTVMLAFVGWPAVIAWRYRDRPMLPPQRRRLARLLVGLGAVMVALVPVGVMLGARAPYLGMIALGLGGLGALISGLSQLREINREQNSHL